MSLRKITETDLQGMGVIGMEDTPNLSAREMQEKVEEVVRAVVIPVINENVDNTASKQDLTEAVFNAGAGDMKASYYDGNLDGIVNRADNGFFTYTHSKSGNIHYLYGNGSNIKFVSTAAFEDGDVFMIGENYYPAFLIDGDSLPGGFFKEDMVVTCFVHGNCLNFKQGGAGLNFKIVGGTEPPASPKENTIWVNTDVAISEYFIVALPGAPGWASDEGDICVLYIAANSSTPGQINILRNNEISIKPLRCYQYVGGSWVVKDARVYINGVWTELKDAVYYDGTWNYTKITKAYTGGTATEESSYITLKTTGSNGSAIYVGAYVDLTDYTKLVMEGNKTVGSGNSKCGIFVTDTIDIGYTAGWSGANTVSYKLSTTTGTQLLTLDISALKGFYYVWFGVYSAAVAGTLQVTEFRME